MEEITIQWISALSGDEIYSLKIPILNNNITINQLMDMELDVFSSFWDNYLVEKLYKENIFVWVDFIIDESLQILKDYECNLYDYHYNLNNNLYITIKVIKYIVPGYEDELNNFLYRDDIKDL